MTIRDKTTAKDTTFQVLVITFLIMGIVYFATETASRFLCLCFD